MSIPIQKKKKKKKLSILLDELLVCYQYPNYDENWLLRGIYFVPLLGILESWDHHIMSFIGAMTLTKHWKEGWGLRVQS